MKTLRHILILLASVSLILLLPACADPVQQVREAAAPAALRQVWEDNPILTKGNDATGKEFLENFKEKLEQFRQQYPEDADMQYLLAVMEERKRNRPIHYNFIIVPDLSMRINPEHYPHNFRQDPQVIEMIFDLFQEHVEGKFFGHQDRIVLRPTDMSQVANFGQFSENLSIDFSELDVTELREGIDKMSEKKEKFMGAVQAMYESVAQNGHKGSDIWKFFNEDLDHAFIRRSTETDSIRNVLFLITDGYIEAGKYGKAYCQGHVCEYLSNNRIQQFRTEVLRSGKPWEDFYEQHGYGLTPIHEPQKLAGLEVVALEFYDRFPKKNPSDYLIVRKFWQGWFDGMGLRTLIDKSRESPSDTKARVAHFLQGGQPYGQ